MNKNLGWVALLSIMGLIYVVLKVIKQVLFDWYVLHIGLVLVISLLLSKFVMYLIFSF